MSSSAVENPVTLSRAEELLEKRFIGCMRAAKGSVGVASPEPIELAARLEPCIQSKGQDGLCKSERIEGLLKVIAHLRHEARLSLEGASWMMEELVPTEAGVKKRKPRQKSRQKLAQRRPIPAVSR